MTCHTQIIFHMLICICCNLQFVNTLTDSISYADADLYPNVHVSFIATSDITNPCNRFLCMWARSFSALRCLKIWCPATMTEKRLCGLAMLHVHRNDTVGQENLEAVLKRFDWVAIGKSILHSQTKYCHLRLFIKILYQRPISCVVLFTIEASTTWSLFTIVTGI